MGLLDMAKSALGNQGSGNDALMGIISGLIGGQSSGGLGGLVEKFKQNGLDKVVSSWISTGPNLPVTAEQLQKVLGAGQIQAMASKAGLSPDLFGSQLSQMLPKIVDQLTPNGSLPEQSSVEGGLALLKNFLK